VLTFGRMRQSIFYVKNTKILLNMH
jgi:hypothetical protein